MECLIAKVVQPTGLLILLFLAACTETPSPETRLLTRGEVISINGVSVGGKDKIKTVQTGTVGQGPEDSGKIKSINFSVKQSDGKVVEREMPSLVVVPPAGAPK